jgi:hypothetical protein
VRRPKTKTFCNGEEVVWHLDSAYYLVCCDCHLVHLVVLNRLPGGRIKLRFYRDDAETVKRRREWRRRRGL